MLSELSLTFYGCTAYLVIHNQTFNKEQHLTLKHLYVSRRPVLNSVQPLDAIIRGRHVLVLWYSELGCAPLRLYQDCAS